MGITPSKAQSDIVEFFADKENGSLSVNAAAGAAKTTTLTLVAKSMSKSNVLNTLALCFNKSIRDELIERLPEDMNVSNFHKIGLSVTQSEVRKNLYGKKVNPYKYSNIADSMIKDIIGGQDKDYNSRKDLTYALSQSVNYTMLTLTPTDEENSEDFDDMLTLYGIDKEDLEEATGEDIRVLTASCISRGMKMTRDGEQVDYNDMLYFPVVKNSSHFPTNKILLIDECQDLSELQRKFAANCLEKGGRVLAVGDPNQSIYGFAGAELDSYNLVKSEFGCQELPLNVCYRCPKTHIAMAKKLVSRIEPADFSGDGVIDSFKFEDIDSNVQRSSLILSRTNSILFRMAMQFIKKGQPFIFKGVDVLNPIIFRAAKMEKEYSFNRIQDALDEEMIRIENKANMRQKTKERNYDILGALRYLHFTAKSVGCSSVKEMEKWAKGVLNERAFYGAPTLSSVHRAKGLEADHTVILTSTSWNFDNLSSSTESDIQELNIKYVALTRSKNRMSFCDVS